MQERPQGLQEPRPRSAATDGRLPSGHTLLLKSPCLSADSPYMDISSIALQSLEQAQVQLEAAATAIAGAGASPSEAGVDTVDLSTAVVALLSAKNQVALNVSVLKTADQTQKNLIDVLG